MEYGYGDAAPAADLGYGDAAPDEAAAEEPKAAESRRPKRRCSVTKYSLVSSGDQGETAMAEQIQQAEILQSFRNGGGSRPPQPTSSGYSTASAETFNTDDGETPNPESEVFEKQVEHVKKGKLSRLRKRLSIF
jgi:hypothetical protein